MSFAIEFLKTAGRVVVSGSTTRVFKKASDQRNPRIQQLWLALSSLAFASSFVIYFLMPFSGPLLSWFSLISGGDNPPYWIFWLGENSWLGLAVGFLIGSFLHATFRFSGFFFLVSAALLLTGIMSLGTAWGVFLGGFLVGALENFWRFRGKEFRLRSGIALAFGLGGLILAPFIQILVTNFILGSYSAQLRWFQWISLVAVFLAVETLASLVFFHFYYAQNQKLTKV